MKITLGAFGLSHGFGIGNRASGFARSSIAADRAEILDLIQKLVAERIARRTLHPRASRKSSLPRAASILAPPADERNGQPKNGSVVLESLERRLQRLEEALLTKSHTSSSPPLDASTMFSGMIRGQMLSDMLQLVSSNNLTGEFVVESGPSKCTLYFDDGRIRHAVAPGLEGEKAFFAAFGFETGRYYFIETTDLPEARTVEAGTQFLILEALRQIDETKPS